MRRYGPCRLCGHPRDQVTTWTSDVDTRSIVGYAELGCVNPDCEPGVRWLDATLDRICALAEPPYSPWLNARRRAEE